MFILTIVHPPHSSVCLQLCKVSIPSFFVAIFDGTTVGVVLALVAAAAAEAEAEAATATKAAARYGACQSLLDPRMVRL